MKTNQAHAFILVVLLLTVLFYSGCTNDDPVAGGTLELSFLHKVDGADLVLNDMRYINAAGNHYEVTEVQWFVSEVSLIRQDGSRLELSATNPFHYIDTNLPSTLQHIMPDEIMPGTYKGISFIFGIRGERNAPLMFSNPPESNMIWPMHMGGAQGGYHYMKLNGYWRDTQSQRRPFNFHLGVGQIYNEQEVVVEFVQNWFEVILESQPIAINSGVNRLGLVMQIENWFKNPFIYDHNVYGSHIMKGQEAMGKASANGKADVFVLDPSAGLQP
ncbi:MAG: hypothetical protein JJU28_02655 [Cyclobacteriaceae bacterium]|nr:hypothetical protein [Cyclobacteriaceae bacterium]